jgi:hypothetical protein
MHNVLIADNLKSEALEGNEEDNSLIASESK